MGHNPLRLIPNYATQAMRRASFLGENEFVLVTPNRVQSDSKESTLVRLFSSTTLLIQIIFQPFMPINFPKKLNLISDLKSTPNCNTVGAISETVEERFVVELTDGASSIRSHSATLAFNISEQSLMNQLPNEGTNSFNTLPLQNKLELCCFLC